jgi:hypothetical protein
LKRSLLLERKGVGSPPSGEKYLFPEVRADKHEAYMRTVGELVSEKREARLGN